MIVGGGIAGVLAGAQLRKAGVERIRIIDQAGGIGGTWYWNRYPGVMCDVESYIYLPMLEELDYVPTRPVRVRRGDPPAPPGDRRPVRPRRRRAVPHRRDPREWDEDAARWRIRTDRGDEITSRYYVLAVGILNLMKLPAIPGMEDFAGTAFHTARWDYEYTGGGPDEPLTKLADKVVGAHRHRRDRHPVRRRRWPRRRSTCTCSSARRRRSACGATARPTRASPTSCEPGWQQERMENFQAVMMGRPVDATSSTTAGRTTTRPSTTRPGGRA